MSTIFISDLHLCSQRPEMIALFLRFLRERAATARALYILGDLFEYWVGDDALALPEYSTIIKGLRSLTNSGVPLHIMHGNRDFLLGDDFAQRTGCHLLSDPTRIRLYGEDTLLMHGDSLCTDDVQHQAWRQRVRTKQWQQRILSQSLADRIRFAHAARRQSKTKKTQESARITDVNQQAVAATMREHGVTRLIHGHTHRAGCHEFTLDGRPARRIVLGDWYKQGSVLRCTADAWELETFRTEDRRLAGC